eukprot:s3991_g8.t1
MSGDVVTLAAEDLSGLKYIHQRTSPLSDFWISDGSVLDVMCKVTCKVTCCIVAEMPLDAHRKQVATMGIDDALNDLSQEIKAAEAHVLTLKDRYSIIEWECSILQPTKMTEQPEKMTRWPKKMTESPGKMTEQPEKMTKSPEKINLD